MIIPIYLKSELTSYPILGERICFAKNIEGKMAAFNFLNDEIGFVSNKSRYLKKISNYPFLQVPIGRVFAIFKKQVLVELINPPF